jgi:hypothetical protein
MFVTQRIHEMFQNKTGDVKLGKGCGVPRGSLLCEG